ncbi:Type I Iterative PKS [Marasmius oreades]|uniref:Type I Iterative PKS n=1 Tax=Marasmius oreades TaxID=181124 RepID=A0A9P7UUQ1_9AGAR|nr:Type I Iterative PKS [Marasmius oreades]KAG7094535.1 Type I Iterative PKS [Marasmius oreades]
MPAPSGSCSGQAEIPPKHEPIAIVGMAINMPGSPDVAKLWEVLERGINTISEIPSTRFDISIYDGIQNPNRQMKVHTGNFISGADEFDNTFFKVSPREARSMDPQQRILLHTAYEALEDSGYVPRSSPCFDPETVGCYVGATAHDYVHNLQNDIDVYYSTGTLNAFLCGRVSYVLKLGGPSIVVDTACSSSSVAIYQACRALVNGDCNAALAGGVNIITSPDLFLGLDRAHFLSPTGQCSAFDVSADGYSRSEGCGMFVLKRLSDAINENDRIYGVIRAIEVNQSGSASSITHPHSTTQSLLFRKLLENAGVKDPMRVNVVEAHGTGTQAGDPTEVESIRRVFCRHQCGDGGGRNDENPLYLTSIKANIGHLETASGAAGLAKLLLMMRYRSIPPQISLKRLNPNISPLEEDGTVIHNGLGTVEWKPSHPGMTRMALLNNFGAAGSNTAALIEEWVPPPGPEARVTSGSSSGMPYIFGFSAKDKTAALSLRDRYVYFLNTSREDIVDVAYTMTSRRQLYKFRAAVVASSTEELVQKLQNVEIRKVDDTPNTPPPNVVFVFSGQGGQYLGMGRVLYETSPVFRGAVDECQNILLALGSTGILEIITAKENIEVEVEAFQSAVFAVEYALAKLWISWGVVPSAVIGHRSGYPSLFYSITDDVFEPSSLGEYAALVIAQVLTLHDALFIVAHRARLMFQRCHKQTSGMLALNRSGSSVQRLLLMHDFHPDLFISCYNGPEDCVVSGPVSRTFDFQRLFSDTVGRKCTVLDVPFGYHSRYMEPLLDELREIASKVQMAPPKIPIASNVLGIVIEPGDSSVFNSEYVARHCVEPVQFEAGIQALVARSKLLAGATRQGNVWIEIGPHPVTLPYLKTNPLTSGGSTSGSLLLPSMRKRCNPWLTLTTSLADLFSSNVPIRWREVFSHVSPSCIHLPSYPFSKKQFWVPYVEPNFQGSSSTIVPAASPPEPATYTSHLAEGKCWVQYPSPSNNFTAIFETPLRLVSSFTVEHSVAGIPIGSGTLYSELVMSFVKLASRYTNKNHQPIGMEVGNVFIRDLEFVKPLITETVDNCVLTITIAIDDDSGSFTISSRALRDTGLGSSLLARGGYTIKGETRITNHKFQKFLPKMEDGIARLSSPNSRTETFLAQTAYTFFSGVFEYEPQYRGIRSVTVSADGTEGYAQVLVPPSPQQTRGAGPEKLNIYPVLMDSFCQIGLVMASLQAGPDDGYICSEVGAVKTVPSEIDVVAPYLTYCRVSWALDRSVATTDVWAYRSDRLPHKMAFFAGGVKFKRVSLPTFKKFLERCRGSSYCVPNNHPSPPETSQPRFTDPPLSLPTPPPETPSSHSQILQAVADTCGMDRASLDSSNELAALGIDSLMLIELIDRIRVAFPEFSSHADILSSCITVRDIVDKIDGSLDLATNAVVRSASLPALPNPPPQLLREDREPGIQIADDIIGMVSSILGVPIQHMEGDTSLDALGLDSLASIEVLHEVQQRLGVTLPDDFFLHNPTVTSIQSFFSSASTSPTVVLETPPLLSPSPKTDDEDKLLPVKSINLDSSPGDDSTIIHALHLSNNPTLVHNRQIQGTTPVFLIHDGSGVTSYYERMPTSSRTLWTLHSPHFLNAKPWNNLSEMAKMYAERILTVVTEGPIILGGWSFGSVAAYETALQLRKLVVGSTKPNLHVQGLLLIDPPNPLNHVPLSPSLVSRMLKEREAAHVRIQSAIANKVESLIHNQFGLNGSLLGKYDPFDTPKELGHLPTDLCPRIALLRSRDPYVGSGDDDVPAWINDRSDPTGATKGWKNLTSSPVKVWDIPGNHFEPFLPSNIKEVSNCMEKALDYLQSQDAK